MGLNWLESIIYALVSGLTEFLPVSAKAHQIIMLNLFGDSANTVVLDFVIHIAVLTALYINCSPTILRIQRQRKLLHVPRRRRKFQLDTEIMSEYQIAKTAALPIVLSVIAVPFLIGFGKRLNMLAIALFINGLLLFATSRIAIGNRSASSMTRLDGFLVGIAGAFSAMPGISRLGVTHSVSVMRAAEPQKALSWCLILSLPALVALCCADLYLMFTIGVGSFGFLTLIQCLVSALFAYLGATLAIILARYMSVKIGFSWFSYYSWGLAFLSFLLFMI